MWLTGMASNYVYPYLDFSALQEVNLTPPKKRDAGIVTVGGTCKPSLRHRGEKFWTKYPWIPEPRTLSDLQRKILLSYLNTNNAIKKRNVILSSPYMRQTGIKLVI